MKANQCKLRRLIFGMSIEDAKSKFDSPDSRTFLRLAHERHNQGILHELQVAQRLRNGMSSERKCHIKRFTKPTVRGFQAYSKRSPDDYVVVELWDANKNLTDENLASIDGNPVTPVEAQVMDVVGGGNTLIGNEKIAYEKQTFVTQKEQVISTLSETFKNVRANVLAELVGRRQSGALISGQQESLVDRLIGEVSEATDKRYKSLSSSTHLLEPVEITVPICGRKDKHVLDAFNSILLSFPAREGDISYSLWIAGGLIADDDLTTEFPYHIAKYIVSEEYDPNPNRPPRVEVEVYFSPELYQLDKAVGKPGLASLRKFIGRVMMKQHEPTPISASLLLNTSESERGLYNLYCPRENEAIQIPWTHQLKAKVSAITGVILNVEEDKENVRLEKKRESVSLVWKAWGHLIKDLHVHGDRDFLYISIDRQKEKRENDEHIRELKLLEQSSGKEPNELDKPHDSLDHKAMLKKGQRRTEKRNNRYVPLSADFVVLECLLERKGLPYSMVLEDIKETLSDMQAEALDMLRLSFMNEIESLEASSVDYIPVLYAPKVVVSNAGIIENRTHSFQRIRIRGSCLAHLEALASSLVEGHWFTDLTQRMAPVAATSYSQKPSNLSFSTGRSAQSSALVTSNQLLGHHITHVSSSIARNGNRFQPHQTISTNQFMTITNEEREFWKENYYRLSDIKIVFHGRVDSKDAISPTTDALSPRLREHLRIVSRKLSGDEGDYVTGADGKLNKFSKNTTRSSAKAKRKRDPKNIELSDIPPEKVFEYLCTDMEAESAFCDLRVGACEGYSYNISLTNIPSLDASTHVKQAVHSVLSKGFINYFGPNRFSSYTTMNMHPGLHLLKDEFRAAAQIIVQQFYLDNAMAAEKRRTGLPFAKGFSAKQVHYHVPDFAKGAERRSVAKHGTMLQKVLSNAIQASQLVSGENEIEDPSTKNQIQKSDSRPPNTLLMDGDPCAEAFANLIGPNVCRILINEFLSFVWNDIVNQRMQRYGTFAILPGDLVRRYPHASRCSNLRNELLRVSRKDIECGRYTHWDVVLPIPGANIQLPDNHTSDLYIVTLKRFGLVFNPELKQWDCFYPRGNRPEIGDAHLDSSSASLIKSFGAATSSPYRMLTSPYAILEEELNNSTTFYESISSLRETPRGMRGETTSLPSDELEEVFSTNDAPARTDLQRQQGNTLGLLIEAGYRSPLYNPASTLQWKLVSASTVDPYRRWSHSIAQTFSKLHSTNSCPSFQHANTSSDNSKESYAMDLDKPKVVSSTLASTAPPSLSQRKPLSTNLPPLAQRALLQHRPHSYSIGCRHLTLPLPSTPYWLTSHNNARLELQFTLPAGVYPSMLLRELTKLDVNTPDIVDIDKAPEDRRVRSWKDLTPDQQAAYRKFLVRRRQQRFRTEQPRALSLALLHQHIFRSGGVRTGLIPTLRSYDSVSLPR